MRRSSWLLPIGVLALNGLLLLASVGLGLRLQRTRFLSDRPGAPGLDYSNASSLISPLREAFVSAFIPPPATDQAVTSPSLQSVEAETVPSAGSTGSTDVDACVGRCGPDAPTPPTNEEVDSAAPVAGVPYTHNTTSGGVSRDPGEPSGCDPLGGGTLWWRYTPDEAAGLIGSTFGTQERAVALGIYVEDVGGPTPLGCDFDPRGDAVVSFPATAGVDYLFQVSTSVRAGQVAFNLDRQNPPERVSQSSDGKEADESSRGSLSLSRNGQYVAFESMASTLVPADTNRAKDVFVHDRGTGQTVRVSVSSAGQQGDADSHWPSISADGRFVAFTSVAGGLVPNTEPCINAAASGTFVFGGGAPESEGRCSNIFVHDRDADRDGVFDEAGAIRTDIASTSTDGQQGNLESTNPSISASGRYIAFRSLASNLVPGDTNTCPVTAGPLEEPCVDVFVKDLRTGAIERVSVSSAGEQGDDRSEIVSPGAISADGRYVVFRSWAHNLIPGDQPDVGTDRDEFAVFVHDRRTRQTRIVSVFPSGLPADGNAPSISANGRHVTFESGDDLTGPRGACAVDECTPAVYVRDLRTGQTSRISVSDSGAVADGTSRTPSISAGGRYVAFVSDARNLAPASKGECQQLGLDEEEACTLVFVRDRLMRTTRLVSLAPDGTRPSGDSGLPAISPNGASIAFWSSAGNLVRGDNNVCGDQIEPVSLGIEGGRSCPDVFVSRNPAILRRR